MALVEGFSCYVGTKDAGEEHGTSVLISRNCDLNYGAELEEG